MYIGRQVYAVGGNAEAARLAGIPVGRRKTGAYVASATLAGVLGVAVLADRRRAKRFGAPRR